MGTQQIPLTVVVRFICLFIVSAFYVVSFSYQKVFPRFLVSATYTPVLKRPVCDFRYKVSVLVFQKFPISLPLRDKTYIP